MSVVIRVSYSTEEELDKVIQMLSPKLKSYKKAKKKEGQYKNAYIIMRNMEN